jgi:hypothetical protein
LLACGGDDPPINASSADGCGVPERNELGRQARYRRREGQREAGRGDKRDRQRHGQGRQRT